MVGGTTFNIGAGDVLEHSSAFAHTVGSYDTGTHQERNGHSYGPHRHEHLHQLPLISMPAKVITGNTAALGAAPP